MKEGWFISALVVCNQAPPAPRPSRCMAGQRAQAARDVLRRRPQRTTVCDSCPHAGPAAQAPAQRTRRAPVPETRRLRSPLRLSATCSMSMTATEDRCRPMLPSSEGRRASTGAARLGSAARLALRRPAAAANGARRRPSPFRCAAPKARAQGDACLRSAAAAIKTESRAPAWRAAAEGGALAGRRPAPSPARRICRAPAAGPCSRPGHCALAPTGNAREQRAAHSGGKSGHDCRGVPPGIARTRSPRQTLGTARADLRMPAAEVKA